MDFAAQADAHVLLLTKDNQALLHQLAPRSKEIPVQAQTRYFCVHTRVLSARRLASKTWRDCAGQDRASDPS